MSVDYVHALKCYNC